MERAERLLGSVEAPPVHGAGTDLPDLAEYDVFWSSTDGGGHDDTGWRRTEMAPRAARPWVDRPGDGLSLALEDGCAPRRTVAASAPMEVPVWPSFLRVEPEGPVGWLGREEEEEEGGWVPPHEYLAREKGRSVATSVLEGVGRTLKGRDMSRVRDAVWSRTGFFG
ncbi:protein S40-6-like [Musa acuminata AAA Group]|uniref:protein S40-6-like n=1 Tax=Musa acuminata AAA Group TaxID=214697 RepID=UPI0031CF5567